MKHTKTLLGYYDQAFPHRHLHCIATMTRVEKRLTSEKLQFFI